MRRKVRNWAAFLLALVLVFSMIPTAYAAGYSITVNAPTGNDLPYWVFEKREQLTEMCNILLPRKAMTCPTGK